MFLLRACVFAILTIPQDGEIPTLLQGDRVLVNRWTYGLRRPFAQWGGYKRYYRRNTPSCGDWIAFNNPAVEPGALPDTSELYVGHVLACPGDTIWMGQQGRVSSCRDYARGCIWPLMVPAKGSYVRISPWVSDLYKLTIERFEQDKPVTKNQPSGKDSLQSVLYRFHHNYYWVISGDEANFFDSRTFGFVPEEFVLGRVETVLYSLDASQPFTRRLRRGRIFVPVR